MSSSVASSSAVGTLNVNALVSQLMAVAILPITDLNNTITSEQTQISAFGTISNQLSALQTSITQMNIDSSTNTATLSNSSAATVTTDFTAVAGTYSLNINSLAQSESLISAGQASSTATIGTGATTTLTFNFGTTTGGTINAATTSGSTTITGATGSLTVGATVTGAGIPAGATIVSITDANHFVISAAATATATGVAVQQSGSLFTSNGSTSQTVTIGSTNNTLQGIASAINSANIGVTATIINDGSATNPYHIAITSNSTGLSNTLQITSSDGATGAIGSILTYDPNGSMNMSETVAAQNANITLNGITIGSSSNTIGSAIQGVTLNLNSTTTSPATLTVGSNTKGVTTDINSFVTAYNTLWKELSSVSSYGTPATSAGGATPPGSLAGDSTVRGLMSQLQGILDTATPGGTLQYLSQIGVSMQIDGTLSVNSTTLGNSLAGNFKDVMNLLTSSSGVLTNLNNWANTVLTPGTGMIPTATSLINSTITAQQSKINQMNAQMAVLQSQYTQQYTNLNMLLTNMNSTSTYLSQQFSKN
jgi:flagellar hook-associated protein 2